MSAVRSAVIPSELLFGTVVPAMVTPMTDEGAVDLEAAAALAEHLVDGGADGLVVTGTTGETSTLTDDENVAMFRTVVEAVGDRARVVAGTGTNDTAHTLELSRRAAETGVDGLLLVTPYYNKPTQAGVVAQVKKCANNWCRVTGSGFDGWIEQQRLWGVYADEKVD